MSKHPLAEVFGFTTRDFSLEAERYRKNKLCPFNNVNPIQIVNVSSVPKRSPFRYAGGKTWIIPHIRLWLSPHIRQKYNLTPIQPSQLVEPFVGGGAVSLTVAAEKLADHVIMVELDEEVAAVWQTILDEDNWTWLVHKIETFDLINKNKEHNFDIQTVPMKNTHHAKMNELCIGPNLEWLRPALQQ